MVDVRILVSLIDKTAAGFSAMAANSNAAFAQVETQAARMQTISEKTRTAGSGLIATGGMLAAPIIGLGMIAAKEAIDVESSMSKVNKLLGASASSAYGVEKGLISLATRSKDTIPATVQDLATVAEAGANLGIGAKDIVDFTESTEKMAVAFNMTAKQAGEASAKMRNVFSLDKGGGSKEINALGDAINEVSNHTAARASDIVKSMSRIGGVTRTFGLSANEAAGLSGSIIALGKAPEKAATAINSILPPLQNATAQSKKFQAGLTMTGISATQMQIAVQKDGVGAITMFLNALNKMEKGQRGLAIEKMFGKGIDAQVLNNLSNDASGFSKAMALATDKTAAAGSMQREFATASATTANALIVLKNNLMVIALTAGKTLLPVVGQLVGFLNPILAAITQFIAAHPKIVMVATGILLVTAAVGLLLVAAGSILVFVGSVVGAVGTISAAVGLVSAAITGITGFIGLLVTAAGIAVSAVGGMGVVLSALAAIALPITGVIALAVGAYLVITNWKAVSAFFVGLWSAISSGSTALWGWVVRGASDAANAVGGFFTAIGSQISATVNRWGSSVWVGLVKGADSAATAIATVLLPIAQIISAPFRFAAGLITGIFKGLATIISPPIIALETRIGTAVVHLYEQISGAIKTAISGTQAWMNSVVSGVQAAVTKEIALIKYGLQSVNVFAQQTTASVGASMHKSLLPAATGINGLLAQVTALIRTDTAIIKGLFADAIGSVRTNLSKLSSAFLAMTTSIKAFFSSVISRVVAFGNSLTGAGMSGQKMGQTIIKALSDALSYLNSLGSKFFAGGANLIKQLTAGISSGVGNVTKAIAGATTQVRAYLPFSPAKVGALSDLNRVNVLGTLTTNVVGSTAPFVAAISKAMSQARNVISPGNSGNSNGQILKTPTPQSPKLAGGSTGNISVTYSPTITITGTSGDATLTSFKEELAKNKDELSRIIESIVKSKSRAAY